VSRLNNVAFKITLTVQGNTAIR